MSLNADVRVELGPDMKSEKKRALLDLTSNIPRLDSLVHIFNITHSIFLARFGPVVIRMPCQTSGMTIVLPEVPKDTP